MTAQLQEVGRVINTTLVEDLEVMLERAKAGEMLSMAYVATLRGNRIRRNFCYFEEDNMYEIVGCLDILKNDIIDFICEDE